MGDGGGRARSDHLAPPVRKRGGLAFVGAVTDSDFFKNLILACIIANAVALGVDAHFGERNPWHGLISQLDSIFLTVFTAELVLKVTGEGAVRFVRNGWNVFDVLVVCASYLSAMPFISALRTLRILRVLRLVSAVPQMRRVVEALVGAMPGILATIAVLAVVFYIGAVMATTLFGEAFPERFGDLGRSALMLFQLTLFDDWGATVREISAVFPWAWSFFLVFTVLAAFAVLNLFIGVIVDAVQEARLEATVEIKEDVAEIERDVSGIGENIEDIEKLQEDAALVRRRILDEVLALRAEVAELRARDGSAAKLG